MKAIDFENSTLAFLAIESTVSPRVSLRERIKIEFYKTYDVMTGIRIAATLGGFFSMMILLVLYKNYCKPSKTLSEEQLNAAVTAAAEEEDRVLQAALEATSFYTALEKRRESLRNTNSVLLPPRFSSVGGGYSHLTPPLKLMQQRGKSLPVKAKNFAGSVMQFGSNSSPMPFQRIGRKECSSNDEDIVQYNQQLDFFACRNYLNVPPSRRVSSVTCSSADSAYLERRCSAFELGLPSSSHLLKHSREKLQEKNDFYYPIDIQVIQPTPEMSPTASERNLNEEQSTCSLQVPVFHDQVHRLSVTSVDIGLAPLASISSLGSFSSQSTSIADKSFNTFVGHFGENQGCACADDSLGSDSVFMDIEDEEFTTDSEFEYDGFDDDYSFCETKQKSMSRAEMRAPHFASFDSFDASITQDSNSDNLEKDTPKGINKFDEKRTFPVFCRLNSSELKRRPSLHEGSKVRKKLMKTYSEPKGSRTKRLPPWTEKGRSGFIPKRQLSSPSARKEKYFEENDSNLSSKKHSEDQSLAPAIKTSQDKKNAKDSSKFLLPFKSGLTDSGTLTPSIQNSSEVSTSSPKQGISKELPFKNASQNSLSNAQGKRSRLQKQKNFIEEVTDTEGTKTDEYQVTQMEVLEDSSTTSEELLQTRRLPKKDDSELTKNSLTSGDTFEDDCIASK